MTDFDTIWRTQDEIRTVVNAVLGECIWNLSYNEHKMGIELELTHYIEEETADMLINQFPSLTSFYTDITEEPLIAGQFLVYSGPTVLLLLDGKEVYRGAQFIDLEELDYNIKRFLELSE